MAVDEHLLDAEDKMEKAVEHLRSEFRAVRTGRASSGLVEHLKIDYYGAPTELRQLATISCPESLMIVIKPYDASSVQTIVKAVGLENARRWAGEMTEKAVAHLHAGVTNPLPLKEFAFSMLERVM